MATVEDAVGTILCSRMSPYDKAKAIIILGKTDPSYLAEFAVQGADTNVMSCYIELNGELQPRKKTK